MSRWRSVNPSSFTPKGNALGALAKGFADVWVPATMKQAELDEKRKYEEEQERKKKAAAAAAAAAKQNEKDKKLARNAKILALQYSGTDKNTDAIVYFTQQLQLMDGDVGDVITSTEGMINRGQLEFTTETQTKSLPMQGPDVPRDYPLTVAPEGSEPVSEFASGKQITAGNVGNFKSTGTDESGEEINAYKRTGDQMAEIFAPVSEEPPVDVERTTYGVKRTPYGQTPDKLDFTRLGTLEDIEMYRMEIESGNVKLGEDAIAQIDAREKVLKSRRTDGNIEKAFSDPNFTGGRLRVLERTEEGQNSDEYLAMQSLQAMHEGKAEKPYDEILAAQNIVGAADVNELRRIERVAKELGATETALAPVRAEIEARSDEKTPIAYSSLTAENYEGKARELEDAGRSDDAALVREFGKAQFAEKPLSIVELGKLNEVTLSALSNSVTDPEYKARIDSVIAEGTAIKDRDAAAAFSISKFDDVKLDTLIVERDNAPEGSPARTQLDALIKLRETAEANTMPELNLDGGFFITSYKVMDEFGTETTVIGTTAPAQGGWYDVENQRLVPAGSVVSNASIDTLGDQASLFAQTNDKVFIPIQEGRSSTGTMLASARRLEQLVNPEMGGNPNILTTLGGDVTRLLERLSNEYNVLNDAFLRGDSPESVSAIIDQQAAGFSEMAGLSSQFQAEILKFAYSFAASTLEQRGAGLSNKDFKTALDIVLAGSKYKTFSDNLRNQALQRIETVDRAISDLPKAGQVILLKKFDPQLVAGYEMPMEQWLRERGLGDMYEWANGKAEEVASDDTTPQPVVQNQTVGTALAAFKNDPLYPDIKAQIQSVTDTDRLAKALDIYSKRFNVPVDVLKQEFGITQ